MHCTKARRSLGLWHLDRRPLGHAQLAHGERHRLLHGLRHAGHVGTGGLRVLRLAAALWMSSKIQFGYHFSSNLNTDLPGYSDTLGRRGSQLEDGSTIVLLYSVFESFEDNAARE